MSEAIDSLNEVADMAFDTYGEPATYTDANGTAHAITAIRFQDLSQANALGQQFEDEGPYVLVPDAGAFERGEWIQFGSEEPRQIMARENHSLRGYLRLTLNDL